MVAARDSISAVMQTLTLALESKPGRFIGEHGFTRCNSLPQIQGCYDTVNQHPQPQWNGQRRISKILVLQRDP